jgi:hypothetical protein
MPIMKCITHLIKQKRLSQNGSLFLDSVENNSENKSLCWRDSAAKANAQSITCALSIIWSFTENIFPILAQINHH